MDYTSSSRTDKIA